MVSARFGSKERLMEAVVSSLYEGPLTAELPDTATGLERVLARLDTMAALIDDSPELMRTIFAIEFQTAGHQSRLSARVADWVARLRADTLAAVLAGQADGSIRGDLAPGPTAHAIVVEGIGSAFLWTVDPQEDFSGRIAQWRQRTHDLLTHTT
jgi:AcrR family transcriptional regulator